MTGSTSNVTELWNWMELTMENMFGGWRKDHPTGVWELSRDLGILSISTVND
jgi:hypothetical protein